MGKGPVHSTIEMNMQLLLKMVLELRTEEVILRLRRTHPLILLCCIYAASETFTLR